MDVRHLLNKRTAQKSLAHAAKQMGLRQKNAGESGTYEGRIDGYFVRITADD